MAMIEGPSLLNMAEYTRKRPGRLLEHQLDDISYYTIYLHLRGCHRDKAETAMSNPAKVNVLSEEVGKKVVKLFFLDEDFNEVGSVQGSMSNGIWIPGEQLSIDLGPTVRTAREGFFKDYDDGLGVTLLAESAAKELVAV